MSATRIDDGKVEVSGERRLVTILFCDLAGSTVLSQRLDPEDYAELVLSYQELLCDVIERNGGVVANYLGDGVVGQFGYPVAHENDAERAVVSGLEICDAVAELDRSLGAALGERIQCRIGTHSSVSVVGTMGTGRTDMSIFGDTANIASRVQEIAGLGQVYATSTVLELLQDEFETAAHQVVELKGIAAPTSVAHVVGRATYRVRSDAHLHLGRGEELAELVAAWDAAKDGRGGHVQIVGRAGLGKTALVRAFVDSIAAAPAVVAKGRALSQSEPFGVLRQLAEASLDLSSATVSDRARGLLDLVARPEAHDVSAEVRWQAVADSGTALLEALAASSTVIVVEDLHWSDASSKELLDRLGAKVGDTHGLLIVTTRSPSSASGAMTIELTPMTHDDTRRLVLASSPRPLSDTTVDDIVARAEGVPLFAVELARGARDDADVAVPESLQAALLARLAARPDIASVARVASVLGDEIDPSLLAATLDSGDDITDRLDRLEQVDVLDHDGRGVWQFSHSLLREAVYSSMLRRDRRALHGRVADILAARGAHEDERLSLLGHHLVSAGRPIEGAACYDTAARRTAALGAFTDAIELAERGLEALGDDPEPSEELLGLTMTRGNAVNAAVGYDAPGLYELWCRAESIAAAIGNRLEQSSAMNGQSVIALFDGNYDLAIERAKRIGSWGRQRDDRVARLRSQCSLALPHLYAGRVGTALECAEAAIELYEDGDYRLVTYGFGTDQLTIAHTTAAMAAFFAGDPRADDFTAAAIDHSMHIESPISTAMSLNQAATIAMFADDPDAALRYVDEVARVCDRFGMPFYRMVSNLTRAAALGRLGEPGARDLAYATLVGGADSGNLGVTLGYYMVALCEESCGNASAYDLAAGGLDIVDRRGERLLEVELLALQFRQRPSDEQGTRLAAAVERARDRGAHGSARRAGALL
jgi:class 3 adenylate cyclase